MEKKDKHLLFVVISIAIVFAIIIIFALFSIFQNAYNQVQKMYSDNDKMIGDWESDDGYIWEIIDRSRAYIYQNDSDYDIFESIVNVSTYEVRNNNVIWVITPNYFPYNDKSDSNFLTFNYYFKNDDVLILTEDEGYRLTLTRVNSNK